MSFLSFGLYAWYSFPVVLCILAVVSEHALDTMTTILSKRNHRVGFETVFDKPSIVVSCLLRWRRYDETN